MILLLSAKPTRLILMLYNLTQCEFLRPFQFTYKVSHASRDVNCKLQGNRLNYQIHRMKMPTAQIFSQHSPIIFKGFAIRQNHYIVDKIDRSPHACVSSVAFHLIQQHFLQSYILIFMSPGAVYVPSRRRCNMRARKHNSPSAGSCRIYMMQKIQQLFYNL